MTQERTKTYYKCVSRGKLTNFGKKVIDIVRNQGYDPNDVSMITGIHINLVAEYMNKR